MRIAKTLAAAAAGIVMSSAWAAGGDAVSGTWRMDNGKVTVRVSDCGGNLCGTIVGLSKPLGKDGKPKRDKHNPNPALRDRPVIGIAILSGLKSAGSNAWEGSIYNPDDGNTYKSKVKLASPSHLKVKGCVAFICKSMDFHKVK